MGILVGIVIGFISGVAYVVNTAHAENYTYNMTKDEMDEFKLSEICYNIQKTNMVIAYLDDFCRETYGDLDSDYGDKIK